MLMVAFIQWWYGPGWRDTSDRLFSRISKIYLTFSVPILLQTLFAPWRRIISYPGSSIQDRFRASIDNLVSRAVGFIVRLMALTAACVMIGAFGVIGGLILILWPILPIVGPVLIVTGIIL